MSSRIKIRRRHFVQVILPGFLGLSATWVLGSCSGPTQQAATQSSVTNTSDAGASGIKAKVLRIGYQQAGDLVRVTGVLEKRLEPLGIKVEWYQFAQGPQLMEAMNVEKVDLGSVGETPPIFAQAAGAQIVYAAGRSRIERTGEGSVIAVPPNSPIKTLAEIKGQKVVFQKASAAHYQILRALDEVGLKYSDIQVLSMPNVEARAAFLEGRIPVWVAGDPHIALAEKMGKIRVLKNSKGLDTTGGYYIAGRQFATDNLELLRIVIEEIDKIGQWAETNPQAAAKILAPEQKLELDVMEVVTSRRSHRLRPVTPELLQEQQRITDHFYKNKLLPKPVNVQEATLTPEQYAAITPQSLSQQ